MSWADDHGERGGDCNECGDLSSQERHAYCRDCYAEQQGWRGDREKLHPDLRRPPPGAARKSRSSRSSRSARKLTELRQRVEQLEGAR